MTSTRSHVAQPGLRVAIERQYGAAIDMLENAIAACPDEVWGDRIAWHEFWYLVYHTLFWLDFYMTEARDDFAPPPPFTLAEMDPAGVFPERIYTKDELQTYLEHAQAKARRRFGGLTEEDLRQPRRFARIDGTLAEELLYNLRHVQHHTGQLNLILRQRTDDAPRWVGATSLTDEE